MGNSNGPPDLLNWIGVENQPDIVFFDGVCNLCNATVDFLIRRDSRGRYRYAPLQGETARAELARLPGMDAFLMGPEHAGEPGPNPGAIVLQRAGRAYSGSGAVLRIGAGLSGLWRLVGLLLLIPAPIRNAVYRWVARNRYRWFGHRETCRLPTQSERARFLP
ncbi:MAG: thiol-disulfide oxidoreductase DCC family protein [Bdellovibrionales bacterium]|nr:thiol-disulfide oxidoreductase DCC family protein [Bdellovibrionales bacterium]